jgi:hypothetical protein
MMTMMMMVTGSDLGGRGAEGILRGDRKGVGRPRQQAARHPHLAHAPGNENR